MAQTIPIDAYLGASKTGLAIGGTIYQLDGSTAVAAFSTTGWYEAPSGSGAWHHPGLSLPDAGGVVAVGVSGTEYIRVSVPTSAVGSVTGAVGSVTSAVTVGTINANVVNASALASDAVAEIAAAMTAPDNTTIAAINTKLGTPVSSVSADIAAVKSDTGGIVTTLGTAGAGLTAVASATNLATANTNISAINTKLGTPAGASLSADVAAIKNDTGTVGVVISTATMRLIADELLKRSVSNVEASASTHSLAEVILGMFESAAPSTTWTIYRTDHSTVFNTRTLTTDAAAVPVTGVN